MKLGLDPAIPYAINFQLEAEARRVDNHLECEVEVVELNAASGRQAREEASWHGTEVRRQRAHVYEVSRVGLRRIVGLAGDQVVGHHQALARPEVARVVEGDRSERGYGFTLFYCRVLRAMVSSEKPDRTRNLSTTVSNGARRRLTLAMCHCIRSETIQRSHNGLQ